MGVGGRHRHNMVAMFQYMANMERVINDQADAIDGGGSSALSLRHRVEGQVLEMESVKFDIESMKVAIATLDEDASLMAGIIEANDDKFTEDVAQGVEELWSCLDADNHGVLQFFQDPDASMKKLQLKTEETVT